MAKECVALGLSVHTGWAASLAVGGTLQAPRVELRAPLELIDRKSAFVYHAAAKTTVAEAESTLGRLAAEVRARAVKAIAGVRKQLAERGLEAASCAVVATTGESRLPLADILRSHPRIHTAEGFFYRDAILGGAEENGFSTRIFPGKGLDSAAAKALGLPPERLDALLAAAGRIVGRPWARDQKLCALAGWMLLAADPG
jgi:hypothetical protein